MSVIKESACTYYSPSVGLYLLHHVSKYCVVARYMKDMQVVVTYISIVLKPKCVCFLSLSRVQKNLENVQK